MKISGNCLFFFYKWRQCKGSWSSQGLTRG